MKSPSVFKRMWDATKEFPKARQNFIQTLSVKNVKGVIPKASASKTTEKLIKLILAREKRKRRKVSFSPEFVEDVHVVERWMPLVGRDVWNYKKQMRRARVEVYAARMISKRLGKSLADVWGLDIWPDLKFK